MTAALGVLIRAPADVSPPVRLHELLTGWQTDRLSLVALALDLAAVALYVAGVRQLARRGRRWSPWRTASFVGGVALVVVAVSSGLASYDDSVFKIHVIQHLLLMDGAPVLLALGAPMTLALQASPRGVQRRLLRILHSRVFEILTFPALVAVVSYTVMIGYFLTPFYSFSEQHPNVHDLSHLVFLVAGSLYWWPVVGLDASKWKLSFPARLGYLGSGNTVTTILGLVLTGSPTSIDASIHTVSDTHAGGSILWVVGELVMFTALVVVFIQFMHADEREAARNDRRLAHEVANAAREAEWAEERAPVVNS